MRRLTGLLLGLLWLGVALPAAEVEVQASVNADRIGIEDTLVYTLTFRGINDPVPPDLDRLADFQLLQTSRSSEFRFSNGVSSYLTHIEYYLKPRREGTLGLPPVQYRHEGRDYQTQPLTVTVVKGRLGSPAPAHKQPLNPFAGTAFDTSAGRDEAPVDVRLLADLGKSRAWVGEGVPFRVRLFTRNRVDSIHMLSAGTMAGFWQEWLPLPASISGSTEYRNGAPFQVFEVRRAVLFPNQAGTLEIPPLQFEVSLADDPWSMMTGTKRVRRATPALRLQAVAPPAAAAGLPVGRYTMDVQAERTRVDVNELLTLRLTLRGSGNFKTLAPPPLPPGRAYRVHPPRTSVQTDMGSGQPTGSLSVEYPVAFQATGPVTLPGVEFAFFDTQTATVATLRSDPVTVTVTGRLREGGIAVAGPGRILQVGEDIAYIREGRVRDPYDFWHRQAWFWLLLLLPVAASLALTGKQLLWDRHLAGSRLLRGKRVLADTLGRLRRARDIGAVGPILESYVQRKSGLGLAEISRSAIDDYFRRRDVPPQDAAVFCRFRDLSEQARFAGLGRPAANWKNELQALLAAVRRIDRHLP